jgi:hypothetical protein
MRRLVIATVLLSSVLARAQTTTTTSTTVTEAAPAHDRGQVLVAVKGGVLLPYGFSKLGASYLVDVELGYALPVLHHRLAITVEGAFTAPQASGSTTDPRLDASTGGTYSWQIAQREVILGLNLIYRHPLGRFTPYVGIGPRMFLLDSRVNGNASGAPISQSSEVSTKFGVGIPVGLGVHLGPGDLFAELQLNVSPMDHLTTGPTNTGSIALAAGYRLIF